MCRFISTCWGKNYAKTPSKVETGDCDRCSSVSTCWSKDYAETPSKVETGDHDRCSFFVVVGVKLM